MAAPEKLAALRHLLAERFPAARRASGRVLRTGIRTLDEISGGLPLAAVTEIVCAAPSCGSHLLLEQLLAVTRAAQQRVALVDATNSFDPGSYPPDLLAHLLWVRCTSGGPALAAADLLTRDANLGLIVLDLRRVPEIELRRTSSTFWYRLQRAVEPTDQALAVFTPRTAIASAQLRVTLDHAQAFTALERERPELNAELSPTLTRQRLQTIAAG